MSEFTHHPESDTWDVLSATSRLTRITTDYAVTLTFENGVLLTLECPFTLAGRGDSLTLDPETGGSAMAPVLDLLHQTSSRVVVTADGTLMIAFDNGTDIHCPPSEDYEAWNVWAPDGSRIVCMPGGEPAVWGAAPPSDTGMTGGEEGESRPEQQRHSGLHD